ncbi:MAG: 16S rRNA (guanine(527)-N(7))-methyltransferase RsmG [Fimbriimonadaceae bacterium]|nr:16S rRNA (guanine(527)-N(7))-methyltransferase RsmG [Fimbriimonadaceae bacterium]
MDFPALRAVAMRLGIGLSPDQLAALHRYVEALYQANERANLTRVPREAADVFHLADSLLAAEFAAPHAHVLDLGPGPGLPTVPLALCRPDIHVTAVEATEKFAKFLASQAPANVEVINGRAEELDGRETTDLVTGRACAPLGVQLEISAAWCRVGGLVVPFRTPAELEECESVPCGQLGLELVATELRDIPGTDVVRLFPVYRKVRATPNEFPRPWARIKAKPLRGRPCRPPGSS